MLLNNKRVSCWYMYKLVNYPWDTDTPAWCPLSHTMLKLQATSENEFSVLHYMDFTFGKGR